MKVLQINIFGNLSTGRIAVDIYHILNKCGYDGLFAFARNTTEEDVQHYKFGSKLSVYSDVIASRITDKAGFYSNRSTKMLIQKIKDYNPDIIHLHNLHGYYINIELLFNFLKEYKKPVVWTLHDCWAYTGHCCYYSMAKCYKWESLCNNCPQKHAYPKSIVIDNSEWNYKKKRQLFTTLDNLHLVCVSEWLYAEVKKSYLKDVSAEVIYNGVDIESFKPTESNFRTKYNLGDSKIILGVASTWDERKGLRDFIELSKIISDDYKIVLVGLNDNEMKIIPDSIIGLSRTDSLKELVGLYTTADVFFNASVEETFGLPTLEAMACGTPVVVYNATAIPEVCTPQSGVVVKPHDIEAVINSIYEMQIHPMKKEDIINRAKVFDKNVQYMKYINLYERLV